MAESPKRRLVTSSDGGDGSSTSAGAHDQLFGRLGQTAEESAVPLQIVPPANQRPPGGDENIRRHNEFVRTAQSVSRRE